MNLNISQLPRFTRDKDSAAANVSEARLSQFAKNTNNPEEAFRTYLQHGAAPMREHSAQERSLAAHVGTLVNASHISVSKRGPEALFTLTIPDQKINVATESEIA